MEIETIEKEVRELIERMEMCLDDDFHIHYKFDINNWITELKELLSEEKQ